MLGASVTGWYALVAYVATAYLLWSAAFEAGRKHVRWFQRRLQRRTMVRPRGRARKPAPEAGALEFVVDTLQDAQAVRGDDLPLAVEGHYSGDAQADVRVILEDSYGNYFLQAPQVRFLPDGKWIAPNVLPGKGIELVHFIRLGDQAKRHFDAMAARKEWGGFTELPPQQEILRSIKITRM